MVKGRLRNPPLAQPECILTRQQTVAERRAQLGVKRTLVVVARVVLQNMTDIPRVGDQEAAPRANLEVNDVAEATSRTHEDGCGIASQRRQYSDDRKPSRARRQRTHGISGWFHPIRRL